MAQGIAWLCCAKPTAWHKTESWAKNRQKISPPPLRVDQELKFGQARALTEQKSHIKIPHWQLYIVFLLYSLINLLVSSTLNPSLSQLGTWGFPVAVAPLGATKSRLGVSVSNLFFLYMTAWGKLLRTNDWTISFLLSHLLLLIPKLLMLTTDGWRLKAAECKDWVLTVSVHGKQGTNL